MLNNIVNRQTAHHCGRFWTYVNSTVPKSFCNDRQRRTGPGGDGKGGWCSLDGFLSQWNRRDTRLDGSCGPVVCLSAARRSTLLSSPDAVGGATIVLALQITGNDGLLDSIPSASRSAIAETPKPVLPWLAIPATTSAVGLLIHDKL